MQNTSSDNKNYGYGKRPLWQWIAIYLVIGLVVYGLVYYFVFARKGTGYSYTAPTTQSSPTTQTTTTTTTDSSNIYTMKTDPTKGSYLADFAGKTLYTYDKDTTGVSNCTGGCATAWPPYTSGAAAETQLPANITVITRADGSTQFAWKGMPLYYFASDANPGQITGDGVDGFHLAK